MKEIPAFAGIPAQKIKEYNREFREAYPDPAQDKRRRRRRIVRREHVFSAR